MFAPMHASPTCAGMQRSLSLLHALFTGVTSYPPAPTMENARAEAEAVLFETVANVLRDTNVHPRQVDILIVNCSLFNPTPSLSAMLVHHFKMRPNVITYNLSGMGCSAGLISISLAQELLQVWRLSSALPLTLHACMHASICMCSTDLDCMHGVVAGGA